MKLEDIVKKLGDHTRDAVLIAEAEPIDHPGPRIVWCNKAFTEQTGFEPEDVIGQTPRILQGDDTCRDEREKIRKALAEWKPVRAELKNYTKDGRPFWSEIDIQPIADETGWYHYWMSIQRDVTARKQLEMELADRERLLSEAIEAGSLGTWDVDYVTQKMRLSGNMPLLIGLPADRNEMPVQRWLDRIHREDIEAVNEAYGLLLADETDRIEITYRIATESGAWRWLTVIGRTVERNAEGSPQRGTGIILDITDRQEAENNLKTLSTRLSLAVDAADLGVWDLDLVEGKLIWDDRMREMYGHSKQPRELGFADWANALHPEDALHAREIFQRAVKGDGEFDVEFRIARPDGETRHIRAAAQTVFQDGRAIKMVGINADVTKDRQMRDALAERTREAEAANVAKSQFLANMSHEIRTPMNGVMGMLDLVLQGNLDPVQRERMQIARDSAANLLDILNDVLDYSKLEAGELKIAREAVDVRSVCRDVVSLLNLRAEEKRLYLRTEFCDSLPDRILGDETRLRQILLNLIGNAVKFTNKGGVVLRVGYPGGSGDPLLRVEVEDTGIGLSSEGQAKLFQRFSQVDGSSTRLHSGTGLGLAISKQLVEMMEGRIGVKSTEGKGSRFWFELPAPAVAGQEAPAPIEERPAPVPNADAGGLRILVVEDHPVNQKMLNACLTALGHRSTLAVNGAEAIGVLERDADFDLVLMDIQMPEMDGIACTRRIRAMGGAAAGLPIVALTANAMAGDRETYLAAGMDDYLAKPIDMHRLVAVIDGIGRRSEADRRLASAGAAE